MSKPDTSKPSRDDAANPYKDTLFLPKTEFPMRGSLPQQEPARLQKWTSEKLYDQLRKDAKARKAPAFMLHDGPPYANGHLHIGTSMNKILKDLVVRTRQMAGFDADFIPGWDCHGLPIEWKVEEEFRAAGKQKRDVPTAEFRGACRSYAEKWIDIQRTEFKRLGVVGNWDDPYLTMAYPSEAATVREFLKVAMSGQLKCGAKPVMWSPVEQTALAEAEIEYADRKATTVWVKFPVVGYRRARLDPNGVYEYEHDVIKENERRRLAFEALRGASVIIWTTTPWTIPANRGVSYSNKIRYVLCEVTELQADLSFVPWVKPGDRLVVAENLAESVLENAKAENWIMHGYVDLDWLICSHPFRGANLGGYQFDVPLLEGGHVTEQTGTGFVHTAPSHGEDDFEIWKFYEKQLARDGIDTSIPNTVDEFGRYTKECPGFEGLAIIEFEGKKRGQDGPANKAVVDKLVEAGALLARGQTMLRDAHSWRSRAPVIRRATPQWFIAMDQPLTHLKGKEGQTLRQLCLAAIDATVFTPERGRQRLRAMVEERPDWLISRQRAWGVPLTLFVNRDTGEILNDEAVNKRIVDAVEKGGADAWFGGEGASFLGNNYDASKYEKINDILDVWFDSGTTHAFTLEDRHLKWPADLYLEGSDQHRGWFQSSLLESCATRGRAPFDGIVTHGFVQSEDGEKMSKSLGNVISPMEVCEKFGADILRIWVASSDYWDDPSFGWNLFNANSDTYRKLRNTLRYLLGALDGFTEKERVKRDEMPGLEKWALHRLAELDMTVREAYHAYDFKVAFHALLNFCVVDLSAVYFDIRKDSLYCDAPSSVRRRAYRTVLSEIFDRLVIWYAPVMVFTCEEAWEQRHPGKGSVHLQQFPMTPEGWLNPAVAGKWETIFNARKAVTEALEIERREKRIGSSLEASVEVSAPPALLKAFDGEDPSEIFITSSARLSAASGETISVTCSRAAGIKCARSWKYFDPKTADPEFPDITSRDAAAVREYRGLKK